jgi:hypothetical protein
VHDGQVMLLGRGRHEQVRNLPSALALLGEQALDL